MRRVETLEYELETSRGEELNVTLVSLSEAVARAQRDLGETASIAKAHIKVFAREVPMYGPRIEGPALVVTVVEDVETGA